MSPRFVMIYPAGDHRSEALPAHLVDTRLTQAHNLCDGQWGRPSSLVPPLGSATRCPSIVYNTPKGGFGTSPPKSVDASPAQATSSVVGSLRLWLLYSCQPDRNRSYNSLVNAYR